MLALLALLLLGRRTAIFLNVIFALMMFAIDHFSNFTVTGVNENAAVVTPLLTFSAGMIGIFVGSKVKTRVCSFLTGFAVCVPILIMIACLEFGEGMELLYSAPVRAGGGRLFGGAVHGVFARVRGVFSTASPITACAN